MGFFPELQDNLPNNIDQYYRDPDLNLIIDLKTIMIKIESGNQIQQIRWRSNPQIRMHKWKMLQNQTCAKISNDLQTTVHVPEIY